MASTSTDAKGNRRILFVNASRVRKTIHLGTVPLKVADAIRVKVEHLNALQCARLPLDPETAKWTAEIGDELHSKLAAVGLVPPRESATLQGFLDDYRQRYAQDWTAGTTTQNVQRCANLIEAFGANTLLRDITEDDAEKLKAAMRKAKLADATIHRRIRAYKNYFGEAVRRKLIPANPFANVDAADGDPSERQRYVPAEDAMKMITVANGTWRTIIGLSRFAGLRCPSEVLMLRLDKVDLDANRMTIDSTKTGERSLPIVATLKPLLQSAINDAPDDAIYVVHGPQGDRYRETSDTEGGWLNTNLRSTFIKLIARVGLKPWPKPFHNMRSSCETDLNATFPAHVVAKWMGHSVAVAEKHYLQVRDADMERAATLELTDAPNDARTTRQTTQPASANSRQETTREAESLVLQGDCRELTETDVSSRIVKITRQGFEP